MKSLNHIILGVALLCGALLYVWKGEPGRADLPYEARAAEIAEKDPSQLSPAELLARLQQISKARPTEPEPQYHIGVLMKAQGRQDDAIRLFQAALRRDPDHVPSLVALGDVLIGRDGGAINQLAEQVYLRAWQLDAGQVRPGILAGYAAAQDGRRDEAEEVWRKIDSNLAPDDPKRAMFDAILGALDETPSELE